MKSFLILLHMTIVSLCFTSCRHNSDVPASPEISFQNNVQPVLTGNCTQSGCHGNTDARRFSLVTYDQVMGSGNVIPGDAHNSNLIKAITGRNEIMPKAPQSPLTDAQIAAIFIWIQQGAKNN